MTLENYLDSIKDKSIAVVGYGISNAPLTELLLQKGCKVTIRDKRPKSKFEEADYLISRGAKLRLGDDYLEDLCEELIFRTPGLHPFTPQLQAAKDRGSTLTSEMEAFFKVCPCRTIAVTGSDGKTTTTTLISELLRESGHKVFLGGNIGTPLLDKVPLMKETDFAVLELSSFQLHSMECKPNIALITNISPNHLDVHPNLDDYVNAKRSIFALQDSADLLVLNADDPNTETFAAAAKSNISYFSLKHSVKSGCFCAEELIYSAKNYEVHEIMPAAAILIPGLHNVENYMAAYAACSEYITDSAFRKVAKSFRVCLTGLNL